MNWFLLNTGCKPADFNMKFDEIVATHYFVDIPTLRLYSWSRPTISIGYHQSENDFDLKKIERDGIDFIRRPTGGRAIFHVHELTYSVIMPVSNYGYREAYQFIHQGLLEGLRILGVPAELVEVDSYLPKGELHQKTVACFSFSAKSEIQVNGKKIIGSAQRRFKNAILQQGSILLSPHHLQLLNYVSKDNNLELAKYTLANHSIDIESVLSRNVSYDEAVTAVVQGFERKWNITFLQKTLSEFKETLKLEQFIQSELL